MKVVIVGSSAVAVSCAETLRKNDSLRKVIDKADEKVDEIRTNDSVIRAVDKAEEVTGKATEALFSGLKKIFNKGDE